MAIRCIMLRPVRGMKDLYGAAMEKYDYIVDTAIKIGKKYDI